jgi:hypothetical protein
MTKMFSLLCALVSMLTMSVASAFAVDPPADGAALWAAADITPLAGNVSTLLIGFIGIGLLFVGYRYIRKSGVK